MSAAEPLTILLSFAHPDDECFGTGAAWPRYAAEGVRIHLFCATDGGAGSVGTPPITTRDELGRVRRNELRKACEPLGIGGLTLPGHPDGKLAQVPDDVLVGQIVETMREVRPQVVVTFGPEGAPSEHPDHKAIHRATVRAFELSGDAEAFPEHASDRFLAPFAPSKLYFVTWPDPEPGFFTQVRGGSVTTRIDTTGYGDLRDAAWSAHRTQHTHRDKYDQIQSAWYQNGDVFHLDRPAAPDGTERDLFAGLR